VALVIVLILFTVVVVSIDNPHHFVDYFMKQNSTFE